LLIFSQLKVAERWKSEVPEALSAVLVFIYHFSALMAMAGLV